MRTVLAVKHSTAKKFMNNFGVMFSVAAANGLGWRAAQAEILRHDCIAANDAIVQFRDVRLSAQRNLVHSIGAVNDEGAAHAELIESAGEKFSEVSVRYADDLRGSSGRVGERTQKIEYGAHFQFPAHGHGVFHGGVHGGREQKTDAYLIDSATNALGGLIERDSKLFEDVRRAAARANRTGAMFGNARACTGNDKRGCCGNVE